MKVRQLVPRLEEVELAELLSRMSDPLGARLAPFAGEVISLCSQISRALFHDEEARRFPELQALAFRMRKAELARLQEEFRALETAPALLVPRGLVFHVPPSNVDTIFAYSWLFAVLTGNRSVIRLSRHASPQATAFCRLFRDALEGTGDSSFVHTAIIQYDHEREITEAVSAAADVRVLWGGDATVAALRAVPLPPTAKELTFPNRYSFSAIHAASYLNVSVEHRQELAHRFYNDTFWFDQMACASPRLIIWCGNYAECLRACQVFFEHLEQEIAYKGYSVDTGAQISKFTFSCRAILDTAGTVA